MIANARMRALGRMYVLFLASLLLAVLPASGVSRLKRAATAPEEVAVPGAGSGNYTYKLEQLSPSTQMQPIIDGTAPYFFLLLTNTGSDDTYHMVVSEIDDPENWFGQVCIGTICFPDSVDHPLASTDSDSVGVNVVPFTEGVDTFVFTLSSLGNPELVSVYEFTLFAGIIVDDVRPIADVDGVELRQASPNPLRTTTSIRFVLPRDEWISLRMYDVTGRIVSTLSTGHWPAGSHSVTWDGRTDTGGDLAAGVYFYRLSTSEGELAKRVIVIR